MPVACLLSFYLLVIPTLLWGYTGVSGLLGLRGRENVVEGLVWLTIALVPTSVGVLMWFLTRSLPLRRERFAVSLLVASSLGFVIVLPFAGHAL